MRNWKRLARNPRVAEENAVGILTPAGIQSAGGVVLENEEQSVKQALAWVRC